MSWESRCKIISAHLPKTGSKALGWELIGSYNKFLVAFNRRNIQRAPLSETVYASNIEIEIKLAPTGCSGRDLEDKWES